MVKAIATHRLSESPEWSIRREGEYATAEHHHFTHVDVLAADVFGD